MVIQFSTGRHIRLGTKQPSAGSAVNQPLSSDYTVLYQESGADACDVTVGRLHPEYLTSLPAAVDPWLEVR